MRQDHYEVLGITPDAPDEVIRAAYKALAAKYHPDQNLTDSNANLKLKRLNAAFRVLGDSSKRKQYDELTCEVSEDTPAKTPSPSEATDEAYTDVTKQASNAKKGRFNVDAHGNLSDVNCGSGSWRRR